MMPRMVIRRAAADDLDLAAAYLACGHQVLESILSVSRGCTELEHTDRSDRGAKSKPRDGGDRQTPRRVQFARTAGSGVRLAFLACLLALAPSAG